MKDRKPFEIIFEDKNLVCVNKQGGLLTIPDRFDASIPNLKSILENKYGEIFVVHRLDKDTSGIVIFAKDSDSHRKLSLDFQENRIERIYHAFVDGSFSDEPIEIDIPIMTDPSKKGRSIPSAMGKQSLTKVKLEKNFRRFSKVHCKLETGRHHQIRVHLSAIGNPLLVDYLYGKRKEFLVSEIKKNYNLKKHSEENALISRNTLHAFSLRFTHPISGEEKYIEASYPKDFKALENILEKYG
jgi:RluA family pseudouridine synthase